MALAGSVAPAPEESTFQLQGEAVAIRHMERSDLMEILTERQHKTLAFIAAANRGGYSPSSDEVELWLGKPSPDRRGGMINNFISEDWAGMLRIINGVVESTTEHLISIGWVEDSDSENLRLTPLGRALLTATETTREGPGEVVVLHHENALSYSSLMGELAGIGGAILVDPYLELEALLDLHEHTEVHKALVGNKKSYRQRRAKMATFLGTVENASMEVRFADDLHDRLVVADDDRVWTLGMSLNTIQKRQSVTVLTPMPESAAHVLAAEVRQVWEDSEKLVRED